MSFSKLRLLLKKKSGEASRVLNMQGFKRANCVPSGESAERARAPCVLCVIVMLGVGGR